MIPIIPKETMQALDMHMINQMHIPSLILMENAAFGITAAVCAKHSQDTKVIVVCGRGNNGGDGFATARQLLAKGFNVSVYLVGKQTDLKGDAAINAGFFSTHIIEITNDTQATEHFLNLQGCVVIDAIFGIGLSRDITGLFATVINLINNSGAYIIGCDIPSGIDANNGMILGTAIRADETVTFQCAKPGLVLYPGRENTGTLTVKEIGLHGDFDIGNVRAISDRLALKKRAANTHKGTYGKLACIVSSQGMSGAGLMCVGSALKAGAGLVTAGVPRSLQEIFSIKHPECMTFALDETDGSLSENCLSDLDELMLQKSALAMGCGLSTSNGVKTAVTHLLQNYDIKKVFDADALNIIAKKPTLLSDKQGDIILTPHLVEFSRLSGLSTKDILQDPIKVVRNFAIKYNLTLLLKGATTIVTNGSDTTLILEGSAGMAKGGSGDVLTGVIGGLLAGGMDCYNAAVYAAYICGKAGEAAAEKLGEYSMTPMDTLRHISCVMKEMP